MRIRVGEHKRYRFAGSDRELAKGLHILDILADATTEISIMRGDQEVKKLTGPAKHFALQPGSYNITAKGPAGIASPPTVAIVVAGFATLMIRLEVTQEGYRLSTLQVEVRQLEEQNQRLRLQSAELSSRERLRSLASKYGLEPPAPGRVVMTP